GGERVREPREDNPPPFQVLVERVSLAIGGRKREVRRLVPDLQLGLSRGRTGKQTARNKDQRGEGGERGERGERKQPERVPHSASCQRHHDSTGTIPALNSIMSTRLLA